MSSVVGTNTLSSAAEAGDFLLIQKLVTPSIPQTDLDNALLAVGVGLSEETEANHEKLKNIEAIIHHLLVHGANPKYWNDKIHSTSNVNTPRGTIFHYVIRYGTLAMLNELLLLGFLKSNSYRFTDYLQQVYQMPLIKDALQEKAELNNLKNIDEAWSQATKDATHRQKEAIKLIKRMTYHTSCVRPKLMFEKEKDIFMQDRNQENAKILSEIEKVIAAPVSFWQHTVSSMFNGESYILPKGVVSLKRILEDKDLSSELKVSQIVKIAKQKIPSDENSKKEDYYVHKSKEELLYKIILDLFKDRSSPDNFSFPAKALEKLLELSRNTTELRTQSKIHPR